jgi:3-hydroxyisobutyrate dehydrogenase
MALSPVAFIGVGAMGHLMVERLVVSGSAVTAYDIDAETLRRAELAGARTAASPGEATRGASAVLMSLPSPAVVERVVSGPNGVVAQLAAGATVIDLSTTDPATTLRVAATIAEAGGRFLDAPVSGGIMGAADGTLTFMVGGDPTVLDEVRPLLERLGTRIVHCGSSGMGQTAKLCNNMLCAANLAAIAETFTTGVKAGLDADVLLEVVRNSSGASWLLESWIPSGPFVGDFSPRFRLDLMHKDVSLFAETAAEVDAPTPVCAAVREMFRAARVEGLGQEDMTALIRLYERLAGVRLLENSIRRPEPADVVNALGR